MPHMLVLDLLVMEKLKEFGHVRLDYQNRIIRIGPNRTRGTASKNTWMAFSILMSFGLATLAAFGMTANIPSPPPIKVNRDYVLAWFNPQYEDTTSGLI